MTAPTFGRAVAVEVAKARRLRLLPVAAAHPVLVAGLALVGGSNGSGGSGGEQWLALLAGTALATALVTPLLLAVLASRLVDVEHSGSGWLAAATTGVGVAAVCRAKLVVLTALVAVTTTTAHAALVVVGLCLGLPAGLLPAGAWVSTTAATLLVGAVVLAVQVGLAASVDNQLVGLGVGVLGALVAVVAPPPGTPAGDGAVALVAGLLLRLLPWAHYPGTAAADYRDGALVALSPAWPELAGLVAVVVVGVVVAAVATRFERVATRVARKG